MVFVVALLAALYVWVVVLLKIGPYMFDCPEYPYELSDWIVPLLPVALKPENQGPPDEPPVMPHASL
jgi:hypothetical protein